MKQSNCQSFTGYKWNFDEKPDEKILLLTGYEYIPSSNNDIMVGAGGSEVWIFNTVSAGTAVMYLSYSRPWESAQPAANFKVKVIVEEMPQPTPPVLSKVHTLMSDKALYLTDPTSGSMENAVGHTTISWSENTNKAFFNSKITVIKENVKNTYEFELVDVKASDSYSIEGTFNIKKNGEPVANMIFGKLYGLDLPAGQYFKFYSDGEKWHMSAFITSRMDY
ncbi:MAG: protease inhibitor I42 family protein [Bacillota bacterium]